MVFQRSHLLVVTAEATSPISPRSRRSTRSIRGRSPGTAKGRLRARGDLRPHTFFPAWRAWPAIRGLARHSRAAAGTLALGTLWPARHGEICKRSLDLAPDVDGTPCLGDQRRLRRCSHPGASPVFASNGAAL